MLYAFGVVSEGACVVKIIDRIEQKFGHLTQSQLCSKYNLDWSGLNQVRLDRCHLFITLGIGRKKD